MARGHGQGRLLAWACALAVAWSLGPSLYSSSPPGSLFVWFFQRAVSGQPEVTAKAAAVRGRFGGSPVPRRAVSDVEETPIATMPLPNGEVALDSAMIGYRQFVPKLYNLCKDLGMTPGRILPSIGFCSDENQGYPTILITKHFGAFPFNHGYIGGIMALDRHGPHAAHGEDMVIIHAPHVGYDPATGRYGSYRRKQVANTEKQVSTCCGKIAGVLQFYREEYARALGRIRFKIENDKVLVFLSNTLLQDGLDGPENGLKLHFDQLLEDPTLRTPYLLQSVSKVFVASPKFAAMVRKALATEPAAAADNLLDGIKALPGAEERRLWRSLREPSLRRLLQPEMFSFNRPAAVLKGERNRLERELLPHMPMILAGPWDAELTAALVTTQFEFDRSVHSVAQDPAYQGKNLLLVSGLNIDISPDSQDQQAYAFPSTMFLPWSAYVQVADGRRRVLDQKELIKALEKESEHNPDAIDIEVSITELFSRPKKRVTVFDRATGRERAANIL